MAGCNCLLDCIVERVTDQDMALLDAWGLVGWHGDQRIHDAPQAATRFVCRGPGFRDPTIPHILVLAN